MDKKYQVKGMTCASCQMAIEKKLAKLDGIDSYQVNLASNTLTISFDDKKISEEDIKKAVLTEGFKLEQYQYKSFFDNQEYQKNKKKLIASIVLMIILMYIAMSHMLNLWLPGFLHDFNSFKVLYYLSFQIILLTPIVVLNFHYFKNGYLKLFKGRPNMDSLVGIGTTASILYSIYKTIVIINCLINQDFNAISHHVMDLYYESAGTILTLVSLGKFLELKSKGRARQTIEKLLRLAPKTALIEKNDQVIEILIENVEIGDIVQIKSGMTVPVDGVILEGHATIDEAMITGESLPVDKTINQQVIGGTIMKTGFIKVKCLKRTDSGLLSQIVSLVDEASNSKAPISKLADVISSYFVPSVIIISLLTFVLNMFINNDFTSALMKAISVLVISCPCALGLATPMSIMVGTQVGAENHILIKSSIALETLSHIKTVFLDKTGTITTGQLTVTDVINYQEENLFSVTYLLEMHSEHPLGKALTSYLENKISKQDKKITDLDILPGHGIKGQIAGKMAVAGNQELMEHFGIEIAESLNVVNELSNQGKTVIYIAYDQKLIGLFAVRDQIKKNSFLAIQELKKLDIKVVMLTGDFNLTAQAYQKELAIDEIYAQMKPQEKEEKIIEWQKRGKVAMVGDGINDSIALARSDVSFAIGAGTDIAIEAADIVLVRNDLLDVVKAIKLSKAVIRNIKFNLFWAFLYNIIGIPFAAGLFGLSLDPMIAALAMSLSSICVVLNALSLRLFMRKKKR